jgi:hypothetical protein
MLRFGATDSDTDTSTVHTHSPTCSLTFFLECAPLSPSLLRLPRFLAPTMELAFTEAAMLVSAVLVRLAVDSANADWIKLDIL